VLRLFHDSQRGQLPLALHGGFAGSVNASYEAVKAGTAGSPESRFLGPIPTNSFQNSSFPKVSNRSAISAGMLNHLTRLFLPLLELKHQLVGHVVLVDVTHVSGRFNADFLRRDDLDVSRDGFGSTPSRLRLTSATPTMWELFTRQ
jgi:hypothetical protein